ncbi:MAG: helix-turn-helix domain-containing protein [Verrucomicrobia bacterium]|nr:helix-turn-helix domain-containing protein [Verrucomicrobiota bacterium]
MKNYPTFKTNKIMTTTEQPTLAQRVGARIERARLMRGLSLRGLAEALDGKYSHTTLQKYEKGVICPDTGALGFIARALDVRPDYFLKSNQLKLEHVEYRKHSKLGKKAQKQVKEEAFEFFERYLEIESILSVPYEALPQYDLTNVSLEELAAVIEEKALKLRKLWKVGMNPIPNVHTMLETHGVKVKILADRDGFDGFSAFASTEGHRIPTVALSRKNADDVKSDVTRLRFTAMHELAHLILLLPDYLKPAEKERACHRFAGAFLIPKEVFVGIFGQNRIKISIAELVAIKEEWGLSCAAIMARARDLGLITAGRYKTFCILKNKWGWYKTKKEPGSWMGNEKSSRFKQMVYRALSEEVITASKACGLLSISSAELAESFDFVG